MKKKIIVILSIILINILFQIFSLLPTVNANLLIKNENTNDNLARNHGKNLIALIEKIENEVHTYIKFYGD